MDPTPPTSASPANNVTSSVSATSTATPTPSASANSTTTPTPSASANSTTTLTPSASANSTTIPTPSASANSTTIPTPSASANSTTYLTSSVSPSSTTNLTSSASANSTTELTPSVSTGYTTVFEVPSEEIDCLPIKDPQVIVNTSSVADGTVVHVSCPPSYTLVFPNPDTDFVTCMGGRWIPLTPTCLFEVPSEEIDCLPIKDPQVIVNTSSVADGTVVHVSCPPSYTLVFPNPNTDFVTCMGGRWIPLTPTCSPAGNSSASTGVIIGCTIGGVICLVLVIVALYMLRKSMKEREQQRERNKEFDDKMVQIGFYINTGFQDPVGMPVLTMDTRDTELRGRVAQTTNNPSASSEKEEPPDAGKLGADLF